MVKEVAVELAGAIQVVATMDGVIYGSIQLTPQIDCKHEVGPITCPIELFIPVDIIVTPEILITQEIDLTPKELVYMYELIGDPKDIRQQKIARYYFTMRASLREIGEMMNLPKTTVYRDLNDYKNEVLKAIKKDLRSNKKVLGHMVELMVQLDNQTRTLWDKYNQVEADARVWRGLLQQNEKKLSAGQEIRVKDIDRAQNVLFRTHEIQMQYMHLLREQTKTMLQVWHAFGLTGDDAVKVILSGGIDVDVKIQETKEIIVSLIKIIKLEVKDIEAQKAIFGRLANDIRIKALAKHGSNEDESTGLN